MIKKILIHLTQPCLKNLGREVGVFFFLSGLGRINNHFTIFFIRMSSYSKESFDKL